MIDAPEDVSVIRRARATLIAMRDEIAKRRARCKPGSERWLDLIARTTALTIAIRVLGDEELARSALLLAPLDDMDQE